MHKQSFSRGTPHERTRNNYGNHRQEARPPRPQGLAEQPALASAIRLKNFKQLFEVAGEENLALALDFPLQRIRELVQGLNFSDETTFHLETTLGLPSGYFDLVNPQLSDEIVKKLKSPLEQASAPEMLEEASMKQEKPVARSENSAALQTPQTDVTVADLSASVAPASAGQAANPVEDTMKTSEQAMAVPGADADTNTPVDANELKLREVRRLNLGVITQQPGSKSHLARLMDMSPANVSHRLHGNKHFDEKTASFFCEKLQLPEGWFNVPHTEEDVPAHVLQLLGGSPRSNVASNRGGRPKTRQDKAGDAPASMSMPATQDAAPALRSAVLSSQSTPAAQSDAVPELAITGTSVPAPAAGAATSVRLARGGSARTGTMSLPQAGTRQEGASSAAASPVGAALSGVDPSLGPIAEALIKTLALKSRQGLLSEAHALRMLTETMAL